MIGLLRKSCVLVKSSRRKKTPIWSALAILVLLSHATDTYAENEALRDFGDSMQVLLPAIGLGATAIYGDWEGTKQWAYTGASAMLISEGMKRIYWKLRPHGESRISFPSGHTTAAFFGAGFLDQRYGKWWGIPAYAAAAVTGYSRVDADAHHFDDVLMGASVGLMSSWLWTTPHEGAISLIPFQSSDGAGLSVSYNGNDKPDNYSGLNGADRWRYAISFGPAFQQENKIVSPVGVGTPFDLENFNGTTDPTTTAFATIERYTGRHLIQFSLLPFEARDDGQFTQPTQFNNTTYAPGEQIGSRYRLYDWRLQYYYDLLPDSKIILQAGGGLSYQHLAVEMVGSISTTVEESKSDILIPLVNASLGYQFNPRFSVAAELSGLSLSDQEQLDANISLEYRLSKRWDAGIGYGIYHHDTQSGGMRNKVKYNVVMTYVGFSFY